MIDSKYITNSREPFFELAKKYIQASDKVLDVGAGDGSFSAFCQRGDIYQFDGNPETVEFLKTRYPNTTLGSLPRLPYEDSFFNLIHCSHIIEHMEPALLYEFLKEADRTLAPNGYLVVSTPLLWENFYNDLSHIKPYSPGVLEKYLCEGDYRNMTRLPISRAYKRRELVFRYSDDYYRFNLTNLKPQNLINRALMSLFFRLRNNGLIFLEKTGYTLVLQKGDNSNSHQK